MCGICGIVADKNGVGSLEKTTLRKMMSRIRHRGPDAEGDYIDPNVALGHQRLSIIDLEHGMQPIFSEDKRYVLIFNGEIYNYLELRQELIQGGEQFHTFSDTEVLLKVLIRDRISGLNKLNGMYAFFF